MTRKTNDNDGDLETVTVEEGKECEACGAIMHEHQAVCPECENNHRKQSGFGIL